MFTDPMGLSFMYLISTTGFVLRVLFLIPEVVVYRHNNRYFYHLAAIVVGVYSFHCNGFCPSSYDPAEWTAYMAEAAVTIQAIADVQHYYIFGMRKEKWFQWPLWIANGFQVLYLLVWFVPFFLVVAYIGGEEWIRRIKKKIELERQRESIA